MRQRVILDRPPVTVLDSAEVDAERALVDPEHPVIASRADVRHALAQRFLDNAVTGQDDANGALADGITRWARDRRGRGDE